MVPLYAALCVVGTLLPLWFLGSFVADEDLDPGAFVDQMTASDVSLFAWADVAVAGLAVIAFALRERLWPPVAATLLVGPSGRLTRTGSRLRLKRLSRPRPLRPPRRPLAT
jgi:Terpene cyclase DEP1